MIIDLYNLKEEIIAEIEDRKLGYREFSISEEFHYKSQNDPKDLEQSQNIHIKFYDGCDDIEFYVDDVSDHINTKFIPSVISYMVNEVVDKIQKESEEMNEPPQGMDKPFSYFQTPLDENFKICLDSLPQGLVYDPIKTKSDLGGVDKFINEYELKSKSDLYLEFTMDVEHIIKKIKTFGVTMDRLVELKDLVDERFKLECDKTTKGE